MRNNIDIFHNFFRSKQHLLDLGDSHWPTYRILCQLAYEDGEDSVISKQAEDFLKKKRADWSYFNQINRIKQSRKNPNFKTLSEHSDLINGVHILKDNKVLSCSQYDNV